jgi:hypothetical protein
MSRTKNALLAGDLAPAGCGEMAEHRGEQVWRRRFSVEPGQNALRLRAVP